MCVYIICTNPNDYFANPATEPKKTVPLNQTELFFSCPSVQVAAAAYGLPGQTGVGSNGPAGGLSSQQAAIQAAQGAALAQQQGVMMQYPSSVQQFQVNGQPTTIAL